jgi:DNA-binding CsgD family transcriptional regulator
MTAPESKTSSRIVKATERRTQAVNLRIGGKTYDEIGRTLGITRQAAHALVVKALELTNNQTAESAEILRQIEIERLEFMRNAIWGSVIKGDLLAIDRALRISKRFSEVTGIDAPEKHEVEEKGEVILKVIYGEKDKQNA